MTRKLSSHALHNLEQLTKLRELLARGELARCTVAVQKVEAEIAALEGRKFECSNLADAGAAAKWHAWKRQEVKRLLGVLATRTATKRDAALVCQRLTAENQVVLHLKSGACEQERREQLRRSDYIS